MLKQNGKHYKFFSTYTSSDGSIVITFPGKSRRITYHTSGKINFHGFDFPEDYAFGEPLSEITTILMFFTVSIPSISRLPIYEGEPAKDDSVWEMPADLGGRSQFSFKILPSTADKPEIKTVRLTYSDMFLVDVSLNEVNVSDVEDDLFIFIKPVKGTLPALKYPKDHAQILYQQKLYKTNDMIILRPDGEGYCKVYFSVPMLKPPILTVHLQDESLLIEEDVETKTNCILRFRVFKVTDMEKKNPLKNPSDIKIMGVELEARL